MSEYEDPAYPDIPAAANSLVQMHEILTGAPWGKWRDQDIWSIANPRGSGAVAARIADFVGTATDTLLVYFVGHGTLDDAGRLCLVISDSQSTHPTFTAIGWGWIAEILRRSPARMKIAIVDSCYSGRAINGLSSDATTIADVTSVEGVYTLTAADSIAYAGNGAGSGRGGTTFTDELFQIVRRGIPGGLPELSLGLIYTQLALRLAERGMPRPNQRGTDRAADYALARNVASAHATIRLEAFHQAVLGPGETELDVILETSAGDPAPTDTDFLLVVDGNLLDRSSDARVRALVVRLIESVPDGVSFAVLKGESLGEFVHPAQPSLIGSGPTSRRHAADAVMGVSSDGSGRYVAAWLRLAERVFEITTATSKRALILVDGCFDDADDELREVLGRCRDKFSCDVRGIGTAWRVDQVRGLASALNGTADIVADLDDTSLEQLVSEVHLGRPRVCLTVLSRQGISIRGLQRLTPHRASLDGQVIMKNYAEYPLGYLGARQELQLSLTIPAEVAGEVARVQVRPLPLFRHDVDQEITVHLDRGAP